MSAKPTVFPDSLVNAVAEYYRSGKSMKDCATQFGISGYAVEKVLTAAGITDRSQGRAQSRDAKNRPKTLTGKGRMREPFKRWCPLCPKPGTTKDGMCEKHQEILDEIVRNDRKRKGTPAQRQRRRAA